MVGAGKLIQLLFGLDYWMAVVIVGVLMMILSGASAGAHDVFWSAGAAADTLLEGHLSGHAHGGAANKRVHLRGHRRYPRVHSQRR